MELLEQELFIFRQRDELKKTIFNHINSTSAKFNKIHILKIRSTDLKCYASQQQQQRRRHLH